MPLQSGDRVGVYDILSTLGAGGMSGRIVLMQGWLDELRRLAPAGPRSRQAHEETDTILR